MNDSFNENASLLISASTALSNQWCEKDLERLRRLAEAFSDGVRCCSESTHSLEFVHGKDGEYIRCAKCGTGHGSASGLLIARQLDRKEMRELRIRLAQIEAATNKR